MACAPRPYALRTTTVPIGTDRLAPMTKSREKWRTVAVFSDSTPTMKPGVSQRETTGSPWASHSCRKRAALSAASASMAPPRCVGTLAITPIGAPSTRASAVIIPAPQPSRSSSTESTSARACSTARMS